MCQLYVLQFVNWESIIRGISPMSIHDQHIFFRHRGEESSLVSLAQEFFKEAWRLEKLVRATSKISRVMVVEFMVVDFFMVPNYHCRVPVYN